MEHIEITELFFQEMEIFIRKEVRELIKMTILEEDIQVYIPEYLLRMYRDYLYRKYMSSQVADIAFFPKVKIYDNYQNKVVVTCRDAIFRNTPLAELDPTAYIVEEKN